jgi:ADP-ribose pyrophosphatase YjhB (NUDIX family)
MAILRGSSILLLRRVREPEAGCWGIPGGKVDAFEAVPNAVRREVQEETGLVVSDIELLCLVDQIDRDRGEHWVSPAYLAKAFTGEPRNCEPEKHTAIGWFELDDPPQPLTVAAVTALAALRGLSSPRS